jgi:hypothetical protein
MQGDARRDPLAAPGARRGVTRGAGAGMVAQSGALLLYTAVIVPIQLFLWSYDDPCNTFPTLYFDIYVDLFFLVRRCR